MIDKKIKNIIFDFGGVILNINALLTYKKLEQLGPARLFESNDFALQDELLVDYEKGLVTSKEFRERVKEKIGSNVDDCKIDEMWNAMLLDIPKERIVLLNKLKTSYPTFLLSNTNEIHYMEYTRQLKLVHGYSSLSELFHKTYFSFMMHLNKPHKEIYEFVINENFLNPSETLFIDDSLKNIEGARAVGLLTHHLTGTQTINDLFK